MILDMYYHVQIYTGFMALNSDPHSLGEVFTSGAISPAAKMASQTKYPQA